MAERRQEPAGTPGTGTSPGIGDPHAGREAPDPASFIGRKPERVAETIPGGLGRKDQRASAVVTQSGSRTEEETPEGHREGQPASDDTVREAGQNR